MRGNGSAPRRDIVVIGASAGGISALKNCLSGLQADFAAAVLVVVHVPPEHPSVLPLILARACRLPASHARDGESIQPGTIVVAPPDCHLTVSEGVMHVMRGPREHHVRPAIDPLFRSAAAAYGPRVIGIILSGFLDDGTLGLAAIKEAGGIAVVQDPAQTAFPSMPESAVRNVDVDYVVPSTGMAPLLVDLTSKALAPAREREPLGETLARGERMEEVTSTNGDTAFSCPDCGGVLRETSIEGEFVHFRCRVGHAYGVESLLASQSDTVEEALWTALRAMEESADVSERLSARSRRGGREAWAHRYLEKAGKLRESARVVRDLLAKPDPSLVAEEEARSG